MLVTKKVNVGVEEVSWQQGNPCCASVYTKCGEYYDFIITLSESDSQEDDDSLYFRYVNVFIMNGDINMVSVSEDFLVEIINKHQPELLENGLKVVSPDLTIDWGDYVFMQNGRFSSFCFVGNQI